MKFLICILHEHYDKLQSYQSFPGIMFPIFGLSSILQSHVRVAFLTGKTSMPCPLHALSGQYRYLSLSFILIYPWTLLNNTSACLLLCYVSSTSIYVIRSARGFSHHRRYKREITPMTTALCHLLVYVFTFGGAKRSGSDRECKYFPIGMNAHEPLWR